MENEIYLTKIKIDDLIDSAILAHGFTPYKRDYFFLIETLWKDHWAGQYLVTFRHCCEATIKVITGKETIVQSWDDTFIDYKKWEEAGNPEGYVWGSNFLNAYPGFIIITNSMTAKHWTEKLGKEMKELQVEAEIIQINLVFYDWNIIKLNDKTSTIRQYIFPLKKPRDAH